MYFPKSDCMCTPTGSAPQHSTTDAAILVCCLIRKSLVGRVVHFIYYELLLLFTVRLRCSCDCSCHSHLYFTQSPFVVHFWCRENRSCILTVITATTILLVVHFKFPKDYIAWGISRVARFELKKRPSYKGACAMRLSVVALAVAQRVRSSGMLLNPVLPSEILCSI
jgi:hypothetical protein